MAEKQLILVGSPDAVAHYATLSADWEVRYANGSIPAGVEGFKDVLAIWPDQEWCAATCTMAWAEPRDRVRWCCVDLSGCKAWADTKETLLAAGLHTFTGVRAGDSDGDSTKANDPQVSNPATPATSSAPSSASSGESPSADGQPAKVAEPSESTQANDPPAWATEIVPEGAESTVRPLKRRTRPKLAVDNGNLARAPDPDDEPLPAKLSEDALAQHFVETRGEGWRYVPEWGVWLEWRGDGWHRDTLNAVTHACRQITRECLEWSEARTLLPGGKQKISSKRMAWNVRDMAAVDPRITILAAQLDADPMLLGVPGGVVDLKTGKLLEAEPEQYITRRTLVAPSEGPHPLFDRVLSRAESDHDGMRAYLLRAFGYALTGAVREEVFFYLAGLGGSGKGTLTGALQAIWGDYADSIAMDALIETKQVRHSQEIAKLEGTRLVFASESEEGRRFNESLIKWLTGGDAITAHRMRMDDHTFKPTFKLLLSGNSVPHLKSVSDGAMKRRVHLIEYAAPIAEEDRDTSLKARLIQEYPAILHTLIIGCVDWQDCHGLGKPESVSNSVDNYMEGEDSFALFLDECIKRDAASDEPSSGVYRRYSAWARNAGEYVMSQKRFVQTLRLRGYDTKRTAQGRVISGLRLLAAPSQEYPPPYQDRD